MAVILDDRAREAIARRGARGRANGIGLRLAVVPLRGMHRVLSIGWSACRNASRDDTIVLSVDERVARYARWHDLTISAWRLGPVDHLVIVDELLVLSEMESWEYAHPGLGHLAVASDVVSVGRQA